MIVLDTHTWLWWIVVMKGNFSLSVRLRQLNSQTKLAYQPSVAWRNPDIWIR